MQQHTPGINRRFTQLLLWMLTVCWAGGALAQKPSSSGPVGQLLNVRGNVMIEHGGKFVRKHAQTCDLLRDGDVVTVSAGASAQALLSSSGARYALAGGSKTQVQGGLKALSGPPPTAMARVGRSLAMNTPGRAGATLVRNVVGPDNPSPLGLVPAEPVTLRWSGDTPGKMTIRVAESEGNKTVYTADVPAYTQEHAVPIGTFKPGVWYTWTVTLFIEKKNPRADDDAPDYDKYSCQSVMRLVAKTDADTLAVLEREAAQARKAMPADPTTDILLAQGYANLGLVAKARAAYADALKLTPDDKRLKELQANPYLELDNDLPSKTSDTPQHKAEIQ